jgi:hypothetical protein
MEWRARCEALEKREGEWRDSETSHHNVQIESLENQGICIPRVTKGAEVFWLDVEPVSCQVSAVDGHRRAIRPSCIHCSSYMDLT